MVGIVNNIKLTFNIKKTKAIDKILPGMTVVSRTQWKWLTKGAQL